MEFVVAVCDVVLPFGVFTVKVTTAPEAGLPPFVTDAVSETLPGAVKFVPATLSEASSDGAVTTVAFASPDPFAAPFAAFTWTAYVPGAVPDGALLPKVTEPDWPGFRVTDVDESVVDQPAGSGDPRLMVLATHPVESLLVTDTV